MQADPDNLYVRLFIDFTDRRNPTVTSEFVQSEGGVVKDWSNTSELRRMFGNPQLHGGTWSDPPFTRKHLFPRLEKHPEWLDTRTVVVVALLENGSQIVLHELGEIGAIYIRSILMAAGDLLK